MSNMDKEESTIIDAINSYNSIFDNISLQAVYDVTKTLQIRDFSIDWKDLYNCVWISLNYRNPTGLFIWEVLHCCPETKALDTDDIKPSEKLITNCKSCNML